MISIIVPVYKVEAYLNRCIKSILNQTHQDFELILVDDGSPDNCPAMCDTWAKKDERIKVIHKENGGLSDARNAGLEVAIGDYVTFVDSDDYIHPKMNEIMLDTMLQTKSDIVSCRSQQVDAEDYIDFPLCVSPIGITTVDSQEALEQFHEKYFGMIGISAWGKLYHRSIFETIRFHKGIINEDEDLLPYTVRCARKITIIENAFYYYFVNSNGITRCGFNEKYIDTVEIQGRHIDFFLEQQLPQQAHNAASRYVSSLIQTYHAVIRKRKDLEPLFWHEIGRAYKARRAQIKKSCSPSRMQKLILDVFPRFPQLAVKIYQYINR